MSLCSHTPGALRRGVAVLVAALALGGVGCGYSTARLAGLDGGHTIAVLPFENLTFRRNLEMRLTEQVLVQLRARTSFGLAAPGSADYVMEGTVTADEAVGLQRDDRSVVQEQYRASVQVIVRDRRSGKTVKDYTVYAVTEYTPDSGGESLQGSATNELLRRLAIRVVQGLEAGF